MTASSCASIDYDWDMDRKHRLAELPKWAAGRLRPVVASNPRLPLLLTVLGAVVLLGRRTGGLSVAGLPLVVFCMWIATVPVVWATLAVGIGRVAVHSYRHRPRQNGGN